PASAVARFPIDVSERGTNLLERRRRSGTRREMRKTAPSRVPPWRPSSPRRWEGTARIASAKWCRGRRSSVVRAGVPGLRSLTTAAVALIAAIGSGCGSKGAVSLSARVEAIELTVSEGPFGASLDGSFDLVLDLGEAAPGAT